MNIGDTVVLKSNPSKIGVIHGASKSRLDRTIWPIKFQNGILQQIPEDQLELYETIESYTLPELVGMNKFSATDDVRQIITQTRINGNLSNVLYSMDATNTDFYAYQFKPVCKIINSPSNSILIADEVGLGKTIEAGLIWTELKQRHDFKRLLIVCPKVLAEKWRIELKNKMGVRAEVVKAADAVTRIVTDEEYALICSIQGLASEELQQKLMLYYEDDKELIDVLIMDEAHYLRNPETRAHRCARVLRKLSDYAIFLSATPIQNKTEDLFSLVHILDEDHFPIKEYFDKMLHNNERLVRLRKKLITTHLTNTEVIQELADIQEYDCYGIMRDSKQLDSLIKKMQKRTEPIGIKESQELAYDLDEINSIGYIYNRTRKRDIHEFRAIREAIPEVVNMNEYEQELYEMVTASIHEYANNYIQSAGSGFALFLLCQPQRMLTSCLYSTLQMWKARSAQWHNEDSEDFSEEDIPSDFMQSIFSKLAHYKHDKELYDNDTKFARLLTIIQDMQNRYPDEKIVLFSSFVPTLEYLHDRLLKAKISSILLTGKVKAKDQVLMDFQQNDNIKVLLASEVGSEGVDLQFCRLLINYDLPWNPMRIEQRIGRLDRIGQKADKILIWNLFHDSTIDSRIYDKLYTKFGICTSVLGDFEEVLGDICQKVSLDLLLLTPEEQNQKLEQAERAIINQKIQNERLEERAAELTAYGDYVLEKIQAEQGKKITSRDLSAYVLGTLRKLYPTLIYKKTLNEGEYSITFPIDFASDYMLYCDQNRYSSNSRIVRDYSNAICSFNNKITVSSHNSEIINQTHPLIKFLRDKMKTVQITSYPCAAIQIDSVDMKGEYLIASSYISAHGVSDYAKLLYSGIRISNNENISDETAENLMLKAVAEGYDWSTRSGLDYAALERKTTDLLWRNEEKYTEEIQKIQNKNYDRAELQRKTIAKHLDDKRNKFNELKTYLLTEHKERTLPAHEGKFKKLEERLLLKLANIEKSKRLVYDKEDICIVLLKVG